MKVIISHDVDHITSIEHGADLFIPKYATRGMIEWLTGYIGLAELSRRMRNILSNRLHNIDALMYFDRSQGVPATYFVGVARGKGLSYGAGQARAVIRKIIDGGFEAGVHGIAYRDYKEIRLEYELFTELSGRPPLGIRMHYLRQEPYTTRLLGLAGYLYDTSCCELRNAFQENGVWEFPLHIMDGHIFHRQHRWQDQTLSQAKETGRGMIEEARRQGIRYLTILFHDCYFSSAFQSMMDWYIWMIDEIKRQGIPFISYRDALNEIT